MLLSEIFSMNRSLNASTDNAFRDAWWTTSEYWINNINRLYDRFYSDWVREDHLNENYSAFTLAVWRLIWKANKGDWESHAGFKIVFSTMFRSGDKNVPFDLG